MTLISVTNTSQEIPTVIETKWQEIPTNLDMNPYGYMNFPPDIIEVLPSTKDLMKDFMELQKRVEKLEKELAELKNCNKPN